MVSAEGTDFPDVSVGRSIDLSGPSADEVRSAAAMLDSSTDLMWAVLPEVAMRLVASGEVLAGRAAPMAGRVRNLGRAMLRGRGPTLIRVGPALFLTTSIQTDRVLRPIIGALESTSGPARPFYLPSLDPLDALGVQRTARRAHRTLSRWLRSAGLVEPDGLEEELAKAEVLLRQGRKAALRSAGIRVLVVASQQNGPTRALIAAANGDQDGPATVYVPHAPVADNPFYRDLPVHHALLRGPSEVAFYRECGVGGVSRVEVVGQPGLRVQMVASVPEADHVVYAASPYADDVLSADIEVIRRIVDRPVEVCLHPRMSLERSRGLFPDGWIVHPPGTTLEVLRSRGAYALIQHGSGVGLEALGLGVEVIDFCPVGERPNYPYIAAPYVQIASNAAGLSEAIDAIPGRRSDRSARTDFARSWCSAVDPGASVCAADAIAGIADRPRPPTVLLDGWHKPVG